MKYLENDQFYSVSNGSEKTQDYNYSNKFYDNLLLAFGQDTTYTWLKIGQDKFFYCKYERALGFTAFHPAYGNKTKGRSVNLNPLTLGEFWEQTQKAGENGVLLSGYDPSAVLPLKECVGSSKIISLEMDEADKDGQWAKIKAFEALTGLKFWVISSGGKSLHGHFLLDEHITTEQCTYLRRLLAIAFESDPAMARPHQPYRAPGFYRAAKGKYQDLLQDGGIYSLDQVTKAIKEYCTYKDIPELTAEWLEENFSAITSKKARASKKTISELVTELNAKKAKGNKTQKHSVLNTSATLPQVAKNELEKIIHYYLSEFQRRGYGEPGSGSYNDLLSVAGAVQNLLGENEGLALLAQYFPARSFGALQGYGLAQLIKAGNNAGIAKPHDLLLGLTKRSKYNLDTLKDTPKILYFLHCQLLTDKYGLSEVGVEDLSYIGNQGLFSLGVSEVGIQLNLNLFYVFDLIQDKGYYVGEKKSHTLFVTSSPDLTQKCQTIKNPNYYFLPRLTPLENIIASTIINHGGSSHNFYVSSQSGWFVKSDDFQNLIELIGENKINYIPHSGAALPYHPDEYDSKKNDNILEFYQQPPQKTNWNLLQICSFFKALKALKEEEIINFCVDTTYATSTQKLPIIECIKQNKLGELNAKIEQIKNTCSSDETESQKARKQSLTAVDAYSFGDVNYPSLPPFTSFITEKIKAQNDFKWVQSQLFSADFSYEIDKYCTEKYNEISSILGEHNFISIKAPLGTGKTELAKRLINEDCKNLTFINLNYLNSLIKGIIGRFEQENARHIWHYPHDFSAFVQQQSEHSRALCLDSLHSLELPETDTYILFLDEIESVINHLLSGATEIKKYRLAVLNKFTSVVKNAAKIIICDANLTNNSVDFISNILGEQKIIKIDIVSNTKKPTLHLVNKKEQLHEHISGENIAVASDSRKTVEAFAASLREQKYNCLAVTQKTSQEQEQADFLSDPNQFLDNTDYNAIAYSPSCGSGVDIQSAFETQLVDLHGVLGVNGSCQLLMRNRNVSHRFITISKFMPAKKTKDEHDLLHQMTEGLKESLVMAALEGNVDEIREQIELLQSSPYILHKARLDWLREYEHANFKRLLVEKLEYDGFVIEETIERINAPTHRMKLADFKKHAQLQENEEISSAEDLDGESYENLSKNKNQKWEVKKKLIKYELLNKFEGIKELPEFEHKQWRDRLIWAVRNSDLMRYLFNRVYLANPHLDLARVQRQWSYFNCTFLGDLKPLGVQSKVWRELSIDVAKFLALSSDQLDQESERIAEICKNNKRRTFYRDAFVHRKKKHGLINAILQPLGLKLVSLKQQTKILDLANPPTHSPKKRKEGEDFKPSQFLQSYIEISGEQITADFSWIIPNLGSILQPMLQKTIERNYQLQAENEQKKTLHFFDKKTPETLAIYGIQEESIFLPDYNNNKIKKSDFSPENNSEKSTEMYYNLSPVTKKPGGETMTQQEQEEQNQVQEQTQKEQNQQEMQEMQEQEQTQEEQVYYFNGYKVRPNWGIVWGPKVHVSDLEGNHQGFARPEELVPA